MNRSVRRVLTTLLLGQAAWLSPVRACDVPVYRYALEHWNPDPYQIVIVHHGPMDADSRALADNLEQQSHENRHGNFVLTRIDADHPADDSERAMCTSIPCGDGPRMVVRFPAASQVHGVAWASRLDADAVAAVADSPCRRDVARRLLAGDAVVWVLLQTGRKDVDDAAAGRVEEELKRPAGDGQAALTCSLVRVSRGDPAEKLLVEALLSSEPDLHDRDEPMAFPVFGRGRVLYALVGAGINAETVRHALDFLVGGCSCTVKRQNPGVDLLLNADWSVITPTTPEEPAAAPTSADDLVPLTPLPASPHAAFGAAPPAAAVGGSNAWLIAGVMAAAVLVLATGWFAYRSRQRGGS